MTRKAVVAAVGEDWIDLLSLDETELAHEKAGNTASGCCNTGCGCRVSGRPFRAAVPKDLTISAGDTIEVRASSAKASGASLIILGVLVTGAVLGWMAAGALNTESGEALQAGGAALGFILGGLAAVFFSRGRQTKGLPVITSVISR